MDFTQKLAVMQLTLPSTRNELDFPGEWYLAENRRFLDLEFFNRIGHEQSFEQTSKHSECASFVMVIASIEDPAVIQKILAQLDDNATSAASGLLPKCRPPTPCKE
jgi:hypothetical protein